MWIVIIVCVQDLQSRSLSYHSLACLPHFKLSHAKLWIKLFLAFAGSTGKLYDKARNWPPFSCPVPAALSAKRQSGQQRASRQFWDQQRRLAAECGYGQDSGCRCSHTENCPTPLKVSSVSFAVAWAVFFNTWDVPEFAQTYFINFRLVGLRSAIVIRDCRAVIGNYKTNSRFSENEAHRDCVNHLL